MDYRPSARETALRDIRRLALSKTYPAINPDWISQSGTEDTINHTYIPSGKTEWAYCGRCLEEDRRAGRDDHIRQSWALACLGYCHKHKSQLHNTCSSCSHEVEFEYTSRQGRLYLTCSNCFSAQTSQNTCDYLPHGNIPGFGVGEKYAKKAAAVVQDFETSIIRALTAKRPHKKWMGPSTTTEFLSAVNDHVYLLAANHKPNHPREQLINHVQYYAFPRGEVYRPLVDVPAPLS